MKDGQAFVYLPAAEIIATRDRSQGWASAKRFGKTAQSPWTTHEDRMWSKTAVRALANRGEMPLSIEFMEASEIDDAPVDYAAYALNPEDGAVLEGEADEIDTDAEQIEEVKADAKSKPETKKKSAGAKAKAKAKDDADYDIDERPDTKPAEEEAKTDAKKSDDGPGKELTDLHDKIMNDIIDTGMPDAVTSFHAEAIARLAKEAPDLHKEITDAIDDAREKENA